MPPLLGDVPGGGAGLGYRLQHRLLHPPSQDPLPHSSQQGHVPHTSRNTLTNFYRSMKEHDFCFLL